MLSSKNSRASNSAPQKSRQRPGDPANSGLCRHPSSNVPHPRSAPSSFAVGPARPQPRRGQANFSRSGARRWIGQRLKQNQLSHDDLFEKKLWIQPALWATHLGFLGVQAADDLVIGDFRGASYDAWKATGTPSKMARPRATCSRGWKSKTPPAPESPAARSKAMPRWARSLHRNFAFQRNMSRSASAAATTSSTPG